MDIPDEVLTAKKAYLDAYDAIKPLLKENRKKYLGTRFELCPPLIKEQGQFFVKKADLEATRVRLKEKYGDCPQTWAYWVAWYNKENT